MKVPVRAERLLSTTLPIVKRGNEMVLVKAAKLPNILPRRARRDREPEQEEEDSALIYMTPDEINLFSARIITLTKKIKEDGDA